MPTYLNRLCTHWTSMWAHAGVEPERGASAAVAAALLTVNLTSVIPRITLLAGLMVELAASARE